MAVLLLPSLPLIPCDCSLMHLHFLINSYTVLSILEHYLEISDMSVSAMCYALYHGDCPGGGICFVFPYQLGKQTGLFLLFHN